MRGQRACEVYKCMSLHFNPMNPYDGWKYNFKNKNFTEKTFLSVNKGDQYRFSDIEKKNPDDVSLIKYWYPLFRISGYLANKNPFSYVSKNLKMFNEAYAMYDEMISKETEGMSIDDVIAYYMKININGMPAIYNQTKKDDLCGFIKASLVFLKFPALNNIVCNNYVYEAWKEKIDIDKRFVSLYKP